jgi:hypothetical protein
MALVDELATELAVKGCERRVARRPHTATDSVAGLDDANVRASRGQLARRRQARQPGACDDHAHAFQLKTQIASASEVTRITNLGNPQALLERISRFSSASTASIILRASPKSIWVLSL